MHRQTWIGLILVDRICCFRSMCLLSRFPVSWVTICTDWWFQVWMCLKIGCPHSLSQFQRLVEKNAILRYTMVQWIGWKNYRKTLCFIGKSMVSCRFSQPIHWMVYPHFRTSGRTHIPRIFPEPRSLGGSSFADGGSLACRGTRDKVGNI